jgi:hypothetical protein
MAEQIRDRNRAHEALYQAALDHLPQADDPAEPFTAIVGIAEDGRASGAMMFLRGHGLVLFHRRKDADRVLAGLPEPAFQDVIGKPAKVHWEARGIRRELLVKLRGDEVVKQGAVVVEHIDEQGKMTLIQMPKTAEDQSAYEAEKVAAHVKSGLESLRPAKDGPPGSYWAICELTAAGVATGTLWVAAPGKLFVFSSKEDGERALAPLPIPAGPGMRWEVRCIPPGYQRLLETDERAPSMYLVAHNEDGQMYAQALDPNDKAITYTKIAED